MKKFIKYDVIRNRFTHKIYVNISGSDDSVAFIDETACNGYRITQYEAAKLFKKISNLEISKKYRKLFDKHHIVDSKKFNK